MGRYILVRIGAPEEVSKGGLVLPGRQKPSQGKVVAVGPGEPNVRTGELKPVSVATGSTVMHGSGSMIEMFEIEGLDHALLREDEILLSYHGEEPSLESIAMPRGRILVQLAESKRETDSGLLLSAGAAEDRSTVGLVVAVGEEVDKDGVAKGDMVRFAFGDEVKLSLGDGKEKYVSVRSSDCIAKATVK